MENSSKKLKLEEAKQGKTLEQILYENGAKKFTKADLIDCEAGIVFLEEMVKHLEVFINLRKNEPINHLVDVEKRIDELSVIYLESFRKELQASVNTWGRRPFEDYIHEKGIYE
jgi:ASC-1-like (ASCH) protein